MRVIATRTNTSDGEPSAEANGTPKAPAPGRVTGVSVSAEIGRLLVSWSPVADADGYKVQWTSGNQVFGASRQTTIAGGSNTRTTIANLSGGTLYAVRVIATRTLADDGPPSNTETGRPRSVNRPPEVSQRIATQLLEIGEDVRIDLADYFQDPEGHAMTFGATSNDTAVATTRTRGSILTVRGIATGAASVTVTARDSGALTVAQSFDAMVGRVAFFPTTSVSIPEDGWVWLTVRLSRPRAAPTTLNWVLGIDDDPDTHDADRWDHGGGFGSVVIPANAQDATIVFSSHNDDDIEPAREVFTVTLSVPAEHADHLVLGPATATITIDEGVCDRTPECATRCAGRPSARPCPRRTWPPGHP